MEKHKYTNKLINETSPYLLQHAHNPVDWYPWSEEALKKAAHENKMIFVSIGYSSCHWCHVMEKESFENESIASFLNEHFIAIKVDREERPDLDAVYMEAVQLISGQGGWPLNVWLTPEQVPIYGGTYFPPQDSYNRPGFLTILRRLADLYTNDPDTVKAQESQIQQALNTDLYQHIQHSAISNTLIQQAFSNYLKNFDANYGGFSTAPKFPMAMGIEFLLKYYSVFKQKDALSMTSTSLSNMIFGGIFDHLGGGFHRYSTDNKWLVPHFEKMLYDNGLILSVLCDAFQVTKEPLYRETITKIISFLEREMMDSDGGFYSSLDADSEGVEGKFYVWSSKELQSLLNKEELSAIHSYFNLSEENKWEGHFILNRVPKQEKFDEKSGFHSELVESAYDKLLENRNRRIRPNCDTKIITSWNSLVLKALCKSYKIFGIDEWKQFAIKNADFLLNTLFDGETLFRTYNYGKKHQQGFLDDYALLAEALTYVFEITGDEQYLEKSELLCNHIIDLFYDEDNQAFYFISKRHEQILTKPRDTFDNAIPGGTSAAITALNRVGHLTANSGFIQTARHTTEKLIQTASKHSLSFGYLLQTVLDIYKPGIEVVIVGKDTERFRHVWNEFFNPGSFYITGNSFEKSLKPLLRGKAMINNQTTAYVCENFICQRPVTNVDDFRKQLQEIQL